MDVRESIVERRFKHMGCEVITHNDKVAISFVEKEYEFIQYDIEKMSYKIYVNDMSAKRFNYVSIVIESLLKKGLL